MVPNVMIGISASLLSVPAPCQTLVVVTTGNIDITPLHVSRAQWILPLFLLIVILTLFLLIVILSLFLLIVILSLFL